MNEQVSSPRFYDTKCSKMGSRGRVNLQLGDSKGNTTAIQKAREKLLDKYKEKQSFRVTNGKSKWIDYERFNPDYNLREIQFTEIVIEFEDTSTSWEAINHTAVNLHRAGYSFKIYDHGGKSPHLHICDLEELKDLTAEQRKEYKKEFLKRYIPEEYHSSADFSLCGIHLIAIEYQFHWKGKYGFKLPLRKLNEKLQKDTPQPIENELLEKVKRVPEYSSVPLKPIENANISLMEKNCQFVASAIRRNDLNHEERSSLLYLYMKLGDAGEGRLREIMRGQKDYKENISNQLFNYYKKKGKYCGISCSTLISKGLCNFESCGRFRR